MTSSMTSSMRVESQTSSRYRCSLEQHGLHIGKRSEATPSISATPAARKSVQLPAVSPAPSRAARNSSAGLRYGSI